MEPAKVELVRAWLTKASRDLDAARVLASCDPPIPDVASYHCQQAAEKALKGFLAFFDVPLLKTHFLTTLLARAAEIEPGFDTWTDMAERLTPLATAYRYPSADDQPDRVELEEAIEDAETIVRQALAFLPPEVQP
jgi:HEPN domain-containing protein